MDDAAVNEDGCATVCTGTRPWSVVCTISNIVGEFYLVDGFKFCFPNEGDVYAFFIDKGLKFVAFFGDAVGVPMDNAEIVRHFRWRGLR